MQEYFNYQPEAIDPKEPWEFIDGEEEDSMDNEYREASLHFLRIMNLTISYILTAPDTLAATYGAAYALGLAECLDGQSMSQVCKNLDLSRGTISNHAKQVRLLTGLPTSSLCLDLDKADKYRESRLNQL